MDHHYTDCYIAFLDILGFKQLINNKTCEDIFRIFALKMQKPLSGFYCGTQSIIDMHNVKMKVMSDSICFFIDSQVKNALIGLLATCAHFQYELLRLQEPILSRGAIVRGEIFADGDIVFGPGFVKAYQMEEHNAKFPRIIVTKSTLDNARDNTDVDVVHYISRTVFSDFDEFYAIDYLELFEGLDTNGGDCPRLLEHINSILGTTTDSSVQEKYLYLKKNLLRWYSPGINTNA